MWLKRSILIWSFCILLLELLPVITAQFQSRTTRLPLELFKPVSPSNYENDDNIGFEAPLTPIPNTNQHSYNENSFNVHSAAKAREKISEDEIIEHPAVERSKSHSSSSSSSSSSSYDFTKLNDNFKSELPKFGLNSGASGTSLLSDINLSDLKSGELKSFAENLANRLLNSNSDNNFSFFSSPDVNFPTFTDANGNTVSIATAKSFSKSTSYQPAIRNAPQPYREEQEPHFPNGPARRMISANNDFRYKSNANNNNNNNNNNDIGNLQRELPFPEFIKKRIFESFNNGHNNNNNFGTRNINRNSPFDSKNGNNFLQHTPMDFHEADQHNQELFHSF